MSRRLHNYRVCVTDTSIYAKVFAARSPRHALEQASIDTERNRDWRADWDIIDGTVTHGTAVEPVDDDGELLAPETTKTFRITRTDMVTSTVDIRAETPEMAREIAYALPANVFTEQQSSVDIDSTVEEVRS